MATHWVRKAGSQSTTANQAIQANELVYQNSRTVTGNITLVQKVTVVATYLWAITDTDDSWSFTLLVTDEGVTPTYGVPEVSDPEVKGQFMFARGPVLYQPRRLISVPTESKLWVRINKEEGAGVLSRINYSVGFLLQTDLG